MVGRYAALLAPSGASRCLGIEIIREVSKKPPAQCGKTATETPEGIRSDGQALCLRDRLDPAKTGLLNQWAD